MTSALIPGLLWAGGLESVAMPVAGLTKVITVLDSSAGILNSDLVHVWLRATNDASLDPYQIEAAVAGRVKTLVHCQLGQNRSSAIAICWLRRNFYVAGDVHLGHLGDTIRYVLETRTRDLATIGRSHAELSPAMQANVQRYEEWLVGKGRRVDSL